MPPAWSYTRLQGDQSPQHLRDTDSETSDSHNFLDGLASRLPTGKKSIRRSTTLWIATAAITLLCLLGWAAHSSSFPSDRDPSSVALTSVTIPSNPSYSRPLILYAYKETANARENGLFFLKHALHDGADFVFILQGETDFDAQIPKGDHITVIKRPNECYDLGAYGELLRENESERVKKYERFILMNASLRGPFLPTWSKDCWSEAYLGRVTEEVKLVGMTYNCKPAGDKPSHIQSMIWATDRVGLNILLGSSLSKCWAGWKEAVVAETSATGAIRKAGYKVHAMMTSWSSDPEYVDKCTHGDVLFQGTYYGTSVHPYETIFIKANRNIEPERIKIMSEWADKAKYSSQPVCGAAAMKRKAIEKELWSAYVEEDGGATERS